MKSIHWLYESEIKTHLNYLSSLKPKRWNVGDVVTFEEGEFVKRGTLTDYGVRFREDVDDFRGGAFEFKSNGVGVTESSARASVGTELAPAEGQSIVSIDFDRGGAVYLQATGCRTASLAKLDQLEEKLLRLYATGKWDESRCIVTEVVHCVRGLTLVAQSKGAAFKATCEFKAGVPQLLGRTGVQNAGESKALFSASLQDTTPLFSLHRLRKPLFSVPKLQLRGEATAVSESGGLILAPLEWDDLRAPAEEL